MDVFFNFSNLKERSIGRKGISATRLEAKSVEAVTALATLLANPHGWPLGWLDIYARSNEMPSVNAALKHCASCDTLVSIGMGGSGLGTRAVAAMFADCVGPGEFIGPNGNRLVVLDNLDEDRTRRFAEECIGRRAVLNPVSKSGNTLEMVANLAFLYNKLGAKTKCVVTTGEPQSPLGAFAGKTKSPLLAVPDDVGGRFSVLSAVSFFPLAFIGIEAMELAAGAIDAHSEYTRKLKSNPAIKLAACIHEMASAKGVNQLVLMPYCERMYEFGRWWVQLFAESLGKKRLLDGRIRQVGMTPLVALGPSDQHSILQLLLEGPNDKLTAMLEVNLPVKSASRFSKMPPGMDEFNYLKGKQIHDIVRAELYGSIGSLKNQGRPNYTVSLCRLEPYSIGQLILFYEIVVGLLGVMFNINAFDQPAVVESKRLTRKLLSK